MRLRDPRRRLELPVLPDQRLLGDAALRGARPHPGATWPCPGQLVALVPRRGAQGGDGRAGRPGGRAPRARRRQEGDAAAALTALVTPPGSPRAATTPGSTSGLRCRTPSVPRRTS